MAIGQCRASQRFFNLALHRTTMTPDESNPDQAWPEFDDDELARLGEQADRDGFLLEPLTDHEFQKQLTSAPLPMGTAIDEYRIIEVLGIGGKATVYKAAQTTVANRAVAFKLYHDPQPSVATEFRQGEVATLARLDHPNLTRILDAGTISDGRRYVVLPFSRGVEFGRYCQQQQLDPLEIAAIFHPIAMAVHEIHLAGFVHCDLKPSNILVDHRGVPTVTDFDTAQMPGRHAELIRGTVGYLAPEQITAKLGDVDARTDVYALGATLYEALVGRSIFSDGSRSGKLVASVFDHALPPDQVNTEVPAELARICMRCLEKSPSRRFQSAADLAKALNTLPQPVPAIADEPTRRQSSLSSLLLRFGALLVVFAFVTMYWRSLDPHDSVINQEIVPDQARSKLVVPESAQQLTKLVDQHRRTTFNRNLLQLGGLAHRDQDQVYRQLHDIVICPVDLRGFAWRILEQSVNPQSREWQADSKGLYSIDLSADGRWLVTSGASGVRCWDSETGKALAGISETLNRHVRPSLDSHTRSLLCGFEEELVRLDVDTGARVALPRKSQHPVTAVQLITNGQGYLVGDKSGNVECWRFSGSSPTWSQRPTEFPVIGIDVDADGTRCGILAQNGEIHIQHLRSGKNLKSIQAVHFKGDVDRFVRASLSPNFSRADFHSHSNYSIIWNVIENKSMLVLDHQGVSPDAAFFQPSPSSAGQPFFLLARNRITGYEDANTKTVIFRGVSSLPDQSPAAFPAPEDASRAPISVGTTLDGRRVAIALQNGNAQLVDTRRSIIQRWAAARPTVAKLAHSPDGSLLASCSGGGTVSVHVCKTGELLWQRPSSERVWDLQFSADGQELFIQRHKGALSLMNAKSGVVVAEAHVPRNTRRILSIDQRLLLGIAGDRAVWFTPRNSAGEITCSVTANGLNGPMECACYDPESELIGIAHDTSMVAIGKIAKDARFRIVVERRLGDIRDLQLSPGGKYVVTGMEDGSVVVWTTSDLEEVARDRPIFYPAGSIAFNSDGTEMATAHFNGEVLLWDTTNWEPQLSIHTDLQPIRDISFSPDGRMLVVGGKGESIVVIGD